MDVLSYVIIFMAGIICGEALMFFSIILKKPLTNKRKALRLAKTQKG
jgi:hypothetical protein